MKYPVNKNRFINNELKYVQDCINSGWVSSSGSYVNKFEDSLSSFIGRKYGCAVSSGTAALEIALKALDIKKGDEVIIPDNTIISCAQAITKLGAKPILIDSELSTWNMSVENLENHITDKTKAIMIVHLYGYSPSIDRIIEIAKKHNLKIIEDASQAIGNKYLDKYCGSIGDISTTSFFPNKQICTGEGGMIFTNDEILNEKCKFYRNLCFGENKFRFKHEDIGWNYRMTNIQAAIGLAQTEILEGTILNKKRVGELYRKHLNDLKEIFQLPPSDNFNQKNIYWVFGLRNLNPIKINTEKLRNTLLEQGVETRPFYYPIHLQPCYKNQKLSSNNFPVSMELSENAFYIPSWKFMSEEEIIEVSDIIKKICLNF